MEGIIHVAGTMPRIGTTTVALQVIQFLKRSNYEAAYVECNPQEYLWGVKNMYAGCREDEASGRVTCSGVDMYPEKALSQLKAGSGYEYLVCDYGNIQSSAFNRERFQDCTAMMMVAGIKPNEIFQTEAALKETWLNPSIFLFNYIREEDEADIKAMMKSRASRCSFAPLIPDPFESAGDELDECFLSVMNHVLRIKGGK